MTILFIILIVLLALVFFGTQKKEPITKPTPAPEKKPPNPKKKAFTQEELNYQQYLKNFLPIEDSLKLSPIRTTVVGVRYANENTGVQRQFIISRLKVDDKLMLVPEENNPHDANAVMVLRANGDQIGYLNMDLALEIKARIAERLLVEATVKEIFKKEGLLEVVIELIKYSRKKVS